MRVFVLFRDRTVNFQPAIEIYTSLKMLCEKNALIYRRINQRKFPITLIGLRIERHEVIKFNKGSYNNPAKYKKLTEYIFEKKCLHHKKLSINEGKEYYCPDCGIIKPINK